MVCAITGIQVLARGPGHPTDVFALMPLGWQVAAHLVPAAVAAWAAFQTEHGDTVGFLAVLTLALPRAFSYALAWAGSWLTTGGDPKGWFGGVLWLTAALAAIGIGWPSRPHEAQRREATS